MKPAVLITLLLPVFIRAQLALPQIKALSTPSDNPSLPAEIPAFTPPATAQTPASSAPVFAEWTRTGEPDNILVFTEHQLEVDGKIIRKHFLRVKK